MSGINRFGSFITSFLRPIVTPLIGTEPLAAPAPGGLFSIAVRYNIRNHFPRPCERKRVKRHGWNKRMSDAGGQRVLMRRILKGKHVYSH